MLTCLRAYVLTCLRVYVLTCLRVYVSTCLRVYVLTCLLVINTVVTSDLLLRSDMADEAFAFDPPEIYERCGRDYLVMLVRTVRGPEMVSVCKVCDLAVATLKGW